MIYLDAAATTLEKPPQVRQAMAQAAASCPLPDGAAIPPPAGRRRRPSGVGPRRRRYSACRRRRMWCSP